MKRILFLLLVSSLAMLAAHAQQYPIGGITISLPANPDASSIKWGTGASMLTIIATGKFINGRIDPRVESGKILVSIKKGSAKICGAYTSASAPSANFNAATKVWNGNNAVSLLGQECILPPGEYEICVQFFGQGPRGIEPISEEKCKSFTIQGNSQQSYNPPVNMTPVDKKVFTANEIKTPVIFRWLGVMPKPRESVTYRLRVWQLMQGQTGTQAMKSNQPLIEKDIKDQTQTIINNLITGPCKPPYLCDLVWNVQALDRDGKPIGGNNGMSDVFTFRTIFPNGNSVENSITGPILVAPANGSSVEPPTQIKFSWLPVSPDQDNVHYKIKIVEIKGNESLENVIHTNKPFFERDSLIRPSFEYSASSRKFEIGKKYAWRVQALNREGKPVGGNNGMSEPFLIIVTPVNDPPTVLKLIMPKNGSVLSANESPAFTWTNLVPGDVNGDGKDDGYYKIKIVEIKGDQSPESAIRGNKPHFEKDSLIRPSFEYPTTAPKFESGKKYGWKIEAGRNGEIKMTQSEINEFSVVSNVGCPRQNIGWAGIAAELNKISNCSAPVKVCNYTEIYIPDNQHLWAGASSYVFSVAEQNSFIATAKQWALSHRPVGCNNSLKSVISITYLAYPIPGPFFQNKEITFSVKYGCCTVSYNQTK